MVERTRRIALYFGSLIALIAVYTTAYRWGMASLEGEPRTWYGALEIVIQSMTTTGYGQDAPWTTPQLTLLMVLIQLTGIAYLFVAFPLFVVPWLNTLVQPTPPKDAEGIADHVLLLGYTELCRSLIDELTTRNVPYLILEGDDETAQALYEDDLAVVHGDPVTDAALDAAGVETARAVVVDTTDELYISSILAIDERGLDVPVLGLIDDQSRARYLRYAGVDEVLSPTHRLGKAIGDKIRGVIATDSEDDHALATGEGLQMAEYPIDRGSELYGVPLARCRRLEATGASVLGAWVRGDFVSQLTTDVHTDENTSVLVAGSPGQLQAVAAQVGSRGRPYRTTPDPVLVVGAGITGRTVIGGLTRAGLESILVAETEPTDTVAAGVPAADTAGPEPDVVGDPTDEETLLEAGIDEARTIVIALADDERAILAALVARELNPEAQILAAVGRRENVSRLRATGVDYVLALPNVAGRLITLTLFEGDVMPFDEQLELAHVDAGGLASERLDADALREATGCAVIALERGGTYRSDTADRVVQPGDTLLVAGSERDIERFREHVA